MSELWENTLFPLEERLEIAAGAIKFRDAQLSASQAREAELREKLERMSKLATPSDFNKDMLKMMTQRAEVAEAKLKEISEAQTVAKVYSTMDDGTTLMRIMKTSYGVDTLNVGDELIIRPTIKE